MSGICELYLRTVGSMLYLTLDSYCDNMLWRTYNVYLWVVLVCCTSVLYLTTYTSCTREHLHVSCTPSREVLYLMRRVRNTLVLAMSHLLVKIDSSQTSGRVWSEWTWLAASVTVVVSVHCSHSSRSFRRAGWSPGWTLSTRHCQWPVSGQADVYKGER